MKCPSVACLWPATAPSHHITAVATLLPSSLFTGGSDGSIIRWSLCSDGQILPLSVLCGHSAPISDLASSHPNCLLSACADAVLCAWSSATGRCRRRRRLPPWAGRPSILSPLPALPRHVCVVADSAIVIVDSWSLNVVQTVLHGGSAIGKVMALAAVPSAVDDAHDLVLVDGSGKARVLMVAEESEKNRERGGSLPRGSSSDSLSLASVLGENLSVGLLAVAISIDGKIMAFVFVTCCLFKLVSTGMVVSEISLKGSSLCSGEGASLNAHLVGGMFLQGDGGGIFALWSNNGAAIVYTVLSLDDVLKVEPLCEVPGVMHSLDGKSSVRFSQLDCLFVRVESVCLRVGNSDVWKPRVTAWSVPLLESSINSSHGSVPLSKLLGEGCFPGYPIWEEEGSENSSQQSGVAGSGAMDTGNGKIEKDGNVMNERIVSSSMVLSEDYYAPYAVVYGFYSGEIEVVRFTNIFPELNSSAGSHQDHVNPFISEQFFEGHTGAVLCLAAHCLAANSGKRHFRRLLVSGSMDCTTRIWDFDSGSLLSVMHHHIAPVKQIILPPPWTDRPWRDCFLSVGEDCCVALVSLETLRVERMFPGHPSYPSTVAWDSSRGYVACLCQNILSLADSSIILYLWDVKSGARERIIRGSASHSLFEHFCRGINVNSITGSILGGTTSASSLLLSVIDDLGSSQSHKRRPEKGMTALSTAGMWQSSKGKQPFLSAAHDISSNLGGNSSTSKVSSQKVHRNKTHPIKCFCPFPGIASLEFDLSSLMSIHFVQRSDKQVASHSFGHESKELTFQHGSSDDNSDVKGLGNPSTKESLEECLLRFSLCFLHLWDVDKELDKLLMEEMNVHKPEGLYVSSGLLGDRGSLTLMFPGLYDTLELWKSSAEFCAMRSLAIVSLAQRMISLSHSSTAASSALAAFYTRNFAEKVPDIKPPLLQLLVSFWQDPSEHVRMAARSLFHCAAPRAIPHPLCGQRTLHLHTSSSSGKLNEENASVSTGSTCLTGSADSGSCTETVNNAELEKTRMIEWLESFEVQEWASCIGGTSQDAMASHIIVAAALVVWYPSIVKHDLAMLVVNPLLKLVMSMNDKYSLTAAELLAEGMESTWKACLGPEIPRLIGDIFFQIECLTGTQANNPMENPSVAVNMKEALVEILLPSLAMADIPGFLNLIEGQIWATSSDSPVHVASLKTLIRVVRGSPKPLALSLDKAVSYVLQTMDPGNLVMRKACLNTSLVALREITRVFPMVAMNELSTRLAVGDAIGDIRSVTIRVYDIESVTKIKILDASGPLGLPSFLEGGSNPRVAAAISALSFSSDGEGLVAFSENGLMIRWWSLGTAWWEKLSRNLVPVQCTKLIFVPPWEGFSPNSSRTSIMASIVGHDKQMDSQEKTRELDDVDNLKLLLHNLDLSYRLQWVSGRNVLLTQHGQELGTFQL